MVTYCVTKIISTCSTMIGQFFDTMIVASVDGRVIIMTHQNLSLSNVLETVLSYLKRSVRVLLLLLLLLLLSSFLLLVLLIL